MKKIFYLSFCIINKIKAVGNNLVSDHRKVFTTTVHLLRILMAPSTGQMFNWLPVLVLYWSSRTLVDLRPTVRSCCSGSPQHEEGSTRSLSSSNTRRQMEPKELSPGSIRPENLSHVLKVL